MSCLRALNKPAVINTDDGNRGGFLTSQKGLRVAATLTGAAQAAVNAHNVVVTTYVNVTDGEKVLGCNGVKPMQIQEQRQVQPQCGGTQWQYQQQATQYQQQQLAPQYQQQTLVCAAPPTQYYAPSSTTLQYAAVATPDSSSYIQPQVMMVQQQHQQEQVMVRQQATDGVVMYSVVDQQQQQLGEMPSGNINSMRDSPNALAVNGKYICIIQARSMGKRGAEDSVKKSKSSQRKVRTEVGPSPSLLDAKQKLKSPSAVDLEGDAFLAALKRGNDDDDDTTRSNDEGDTTIDGRSIAYSFNHL